VNRLDSKTATLYSHWPCNFFLPTPIFKLCPVPRLFRLTGPLLLITKNVHIVCCKVVQFIKRRTSWNLCLDQETNSRVNKWTDRNLMQFHKGKYKVLRLGRSNPRHQYLLGAHQLETRGRAFGGCTRLLMECLGDGSMSGKGIDLRDLRETSVEK